MMRIFFSIVLLGLILVVSCKKEEPTPCRACYCFSFVAPLRISYQDENGVDLLKQDGFTIDSMKGRILMEDFTRSEELVHMEYEQRNWVVNSTDNHKYSFLDIENDLVGISVGDPRYPGIGEDHEFYIYLNSNEIDTFNVKWDQVSGPVDECCWCTGFKYDYLKYNQTVIEEGTDTGAGIVRRK